MDYFLTFEESFNLFPGFAYEVQGVFQEREADGRIRFYSYAVIAFDARSTAPVLYEQRARRSRTTGPEIYSSKEE